MTKRFADGTMDPLLLDRMREIAAENTMRTGVAHTYRKIPSDIIEAAMVYSRGVKANLFRYLYYWYGYSIPEIRDALKVRAPAHVWNTINAWGSLESELRADWRNIAIEAKKNREAIDEEIAKAERKDARMAAKAKREAAAAAKKQKEEEARKSRTRRK